MTKVDFAIAVLLAIGAPVNSANVSALLSWMNAEGGNWNNTARYNPLNTTLPYNGSTTMSGGNSAGVQAYGSWADGLAATVRTLNGGYYAAIIAALKNSAGCGAVAGAVASSPWGTGSFSCNQSVTDAQVQQAQADPGALIAPTTVGGGGSSSGGASSSGAPDATTAGLNANPGDFFGIPGLLGSGAAAAFAPIWNDAKKFILIGGFVSAGLALAVAGVIILAEKPVAEATDEAADTAGKLAPLAMAAA